MDQTNVDIASTDILNVLGSRPFLGVLGNLRSFPILVTDADDRVVWGNRSFEELSGWQISDILGQHPASFLHGARTCRTVVQRLHELWAGRMPFQCEILNYRRDGSEFWVSVDAQPVFGPRQQFLGYLSLQTDVTARRLAEEEVERDHRLLSAISEVQSEFIVNDKEATIFDKLLAQLLTLTESEYGFIGEVRHDEHGSPWMKTLAMTDIAWNEETRNMVAERGIEGLEFRNLNTLFGVVLRTGEPLISNTPADDPRRGGLPEGHPPLDSFGGVPIIHEGRMVAIIGIANRPGGFDQKLFDFLLPLMRTIGHMVVARRRQQERDEFQKALHETEAFLEATGLVAGVGGWQLDFATGKLRWTEQTKRIHEVDPDFDPTVEDAINFYAPEARSVIREAVEKCQTMGTPWDLELPFITAKGRPLWVRAKGQVELQDGAAIRAYGTFQDITDRYKAELVTKSQNQILELIAAKTPLSETLHAIALATQARLTGKRVAIILNDARHNKMRVGAAPDYSQDYLERVEGLAIEPLHGTCGAALSSGTEMVTLDTSEAACWSLFRDLAAENQIVSCWSTPILHVDATVLGCFTVANDTRYVPSQQDRQAVDEAIYLARIAILRDAEDAALQRNESLLKEANRRARLGYWLLDLANDRIEASDESFRLFGVERFSSWRTDRKLEQLVHPEDLDAIRSVCVKALASPGVVHDIDIRTNPQNGPLRWIAVEGVVSCDEADRPNSMNGTVLEITERVQESNERSALQAQLLQAQKMESIGRLAGGIAHDFNNMLAVILGHAEIALLKEDLPDFLHEHLKAIQTAGQRSADLTRQLLAFARRQNAEPRVIQLNDSVANLLQMLRRLLSPDTHLLWSPSDHPWSILIDPVQVDQVLANLLVNAKDAIAAKGEILISTRNVASTGSNIHYGQVYLPSGEWVELSVSDNGCGMSEDVVERIFEPFFTTKPLGEGTGLGLATVFGIVQQNSGHIFVQSAPGVGTTIHVYLRRCEEGLRQPLDSQPDLPGRVNGGLVLLVEDEPAILQIGRSYLQQLGYSVLTAPGPVDAIRQFESHEEAIEMLVTDMVMPEMSGQDLMKHVRRIRPNLPVLFISGFVPARFHEQGFLMPGTHIISKPFELQALAAAIRTTIAKAKSEIKSAP